MEKWSGSGNLEWENEKTGDKVSPSIEDHLVHVDFKKLCTHADGTYCCFCVTRLRRAAEMAERLLRSMSSHAVEGEPDQFPDRLALVNSFTKNAFCLKRDIVWKVSGSCVIHGRAKGETGTSQKLLTVLERETLSRVTDAQYIRGFRVRLGKDTSEEDVRRLWGCPSSFLIDGDYVVQQIPFRDLLGKSEVFFEQTPVATLFGANTIKNPD